MCHGSCCCCCCCLHTIGSVIGAAVAPAIGSGSPMPLMFYYDEDTGEKVPDIRKPGLSAVALFWWLVAAFSALGCVFGLAAGRAAEGLLVSSVIVLMVFPAIQLLAAIVTLIVYAIWPRPDKARQLKQLGKITLGVVLGTIAGIGIMVAIGVMISAANR